MQQKKNLKETSESSEERYYAQDWLPFEKTVYGMLKLKDGRFVKVVEIRPITFLLRSFEERASIIEEMYAWLKIAPKTLQFHITTGFVDSSSLLERMANKNDEAECEAYRERKKEMLSKVKRMASVEALSKRFFVLYEYEGEDDGTYSTDEKVIWENMERTLATMRTFFSKMGNQIVDHTNGENVFLGELLYKELNPLSQQTQSLKERIERIYSDKIKYQASKGIKVDVTDLDERDFVAPRGLSFENASYVIKDGIYETYLYVKANGYHDTVASGWFSDFFLSYGEGVTVNLFAKKKNRISTIEQVSRSLRIKDSQSRDRGRSDFEVKGLKTEVENADIIRERMANNNEDLYDCFTMLTIRKESYKEMIELKNRIKKELFARDIYVGDCMFHMEEAARMSLPWLCIDEALFEKGRRNFLTSSLASSYMYTAYEVYDENGICLGLNINNRSLMVTDIFDTKKYPNANMIILGSSGFGKTFLLMLLAYSFRLTGRPVFVILPEKGHEWKRLVQAIGGTYVELAPGYKDCINIMAIRPQVELDESLIDTADVDDSPLLSKKIQQIITWIQLNKPNNQMTDEEESAISTVLTKLYDSFGITADNDSIWEDEEKRILKPMPIIEDFYKLAKEDEILKPRVAIVLRDYVEGDCKNMNAQTNVDLNNDFTVISVSKAGKRKLAAFGFLAVDCAYDMIKADRTKQCILEMDEVWKFMINEYSSEYIMEIYKIIRGYGGAAISATQQLDDISKSTNGSGIIANAKTKILLGMEKEAINRLEQITDISEDDKKMIASFERGDAYYVANGDKIPIHIVAPDEWIKYFTTDANVLRALKEKTEENDDGSTTE